MYNGISNGCYAYATHTAQAINTKATHTARSDAATTMSNSVD